MTGRPMGTREEVCRKGLHEMTPGNIRVVFRVLRSDGYGPYEQHQCRACLNETKARWRERNREAIRAYDRAYKARTT